MTQTLAKGCDTFSATPDRSSPGPGPGALLPAPTRYSNALDALLATDSVLPGASGAIGYAGPAGSQPPISSIQTTGRGPARRVKLGTDPCSTPLQEKTLRTWSLGAITPV